MTVLLIAGIAVILAGLAAIGFGVPVKEFGFGNTLILTGAVGVCTGLIILALGLVVREMRKLAATIGMRDHAPMSVAPRRRELNLAPAMDEADEDEQDVPAQMPPFGRDNPPRPSAPEPGVPPWQDEMLRDRERMAAAATGGDGDEPKRRNLLFTSTRREREKDQAEIAVAQALQLDLDMPADDAPAEPRGFGDNWRQERPQAERQLDRPHAERAPAERPHTDRSQADRSQPDRSQPDRAPTERAPTERAPAEPRPQAPRFSDAIRQAARASATHAERFGGLPDLSQIPDRDEPEPAPPAGVSVLKRGIVDGMAYALYSDGSIEAQMPEGVMRFASIDELRQHLDHRG